MEEKELLKEALDKSLLYYMDLEEMEADFTRGPQERALTLPIHIGMS